MAAVYRRCNLENCGNSCAINGFRILNTFKSSVPFNFSLTIMPFVAVLRYTSKENKLSYIETIDDTPNFKGKFSYSRYVGSP